MLYKINATDNASEQLDDFSHYYKSVSKETYRKFSLDIRLILFMLKTNPEIYRVRYKKVRRVNFKNFPVALLFEISEDRVNILYAWHHRSKFL